MALQNFRLVGTVKFGVAALDRNMIMADVMRARVTPTSYYIGFFPGLLATFLGSAISGIAVFRRRTAQLFKGRSGSDIIPCPSVC